MRPLRYSINVTLDGCIDHRVGIADEHLHRHAAAFLGRADALLFGRVTYELMRSAWMLPASSEPGPDPTDPFVQVINWAKKYLVSSTISNPDWNTQLVQGDLEEAVRQLKNEPGTGIATGGVQLPMALAELGLIDEYEIIVHPRIVGHGPSLFAGLSNYVDLQLVSRDELPSGAVVLQYEPRS